MSRPPMTRVQWRAGIHERIVQVGECSEWTGDFSGVTPVVYTPAGFAWPESLKGKQSVRGVLLFMEKGRRLTADQVIRPRCMNPQCVDVRHFQVITRAQQAREQSRRGELQTAQARAAKTLVGRRNAKLDDLAIRQILTSCTTSAEEAARHGVHRSTVSAVRRGDLWAHVLPAASVFTWARASA